ncbi:Rha family transcriptional regulator [Sphingobacterium endophyticum]|uniref:Rha family transcriptional regulator n=1 Tax=Sphingobacterium endophyticum TaxID=2546448 RepID=UPI0018CE7465|nr:Rha family transcriptional regulator [Sphingobacterium endophyticum]
MINIVKLNDSGQGNQNFENKKISSREIAELTGKTHDNVLKAIRAMEQAWIKVTGVKFNASE